LPKAEETGIVANAMKNRLGVVILTLVCLGLFIALISIKRQASSERTVVAQQAQDLSNRWLEADQKLAEQTNVYGLLEKDMQAQKANFEKTLADLTNNYSTVAENLAKTEADLKTAREEMKQRDSKIAELEKENQSLDRQAGELNAAITNLNAQIADTNGKLAASEGDKALLEKELKRLMGEKVELERQFNDLNVLRAQVAKIRQEMNVARRMEWMRSGLLASSEQKGAQKLMQGLHAPATPTGKTTPKPNYDLNVEVTADGSVRVVPPASNTPAK
jgi:chromosome segregation ATPase